MGGGGAWNFFESTFDERYLERKVAANAGSYRLGGQALGIGVDVLPRCTGSSREQMQGYFPSLLPASPPVHDSAVVPVWEDRLEN